MTGHLLTAFTWLLLLSPIARGSASIASDALDFRSNIRTADFADSLKAGTTALLAAIDSINGEKGGKVLVCASDCRLAKPGSAQELLFGDGAAALLLGNDDVIASFEGSYSVSYDFPDYRRSENDKFVRVVEERFIREEGYSKFIPEAISGLLNKLGLDAKYVTKVAYPCLFSREHAAIGKSLKFEPGQIQKPLSSEIGESGTASSLMLLVAMLEEAKPGDNILVASYGNGAEALLFKVTEQIKKVSDRRGVNKYLTAKKELLSYEKYLAFRDILPVEVGVGEDTAPTQLPLTWRDRKGLLALYGSRCKRCSTPLYPAQRVCVNPKCGAIDEMEDYRFSDKKGILFSYTEDHSAATLNPPLIFGMVDFENGGRFVFEVTDCEPGSVRAGLPVEMCLRRMYVDKLRGIHGYFWKAIPVRE